VKDYRKWENTFLLVNKLFLKNKIEHVFIKMLLNPFHMRDVDVLLPNIADEKLAIELLKDEGFYPHRAGRLLHPWKIICEGFGDYLSVDLHHTAEWNRTIVGDGKEIVSRKITYKVGKTKAFLPTPEDSFYLIATHAFYQHGTITLPEVLNCRNLLLDKRFSWKRLYTTSAKYGTTDAVYAFLLSIKLKTPKAVNKKILDLFSHGPTGAFVKRWFEKSEKKFPLTVPRWLGCIFPSFTHTKTLIKKVPASDLFFDFLSHYMRIVGERGALI